MQTTQGGTNMPGIDDPTAAIVIIETIKTLENQNAQLGPDAGGPGVPMTLEVEAQGQQSSELGQIGPFGWIGIAILICIVCACAVNIYLKAQKKSFDRAPTKEELNNLAPGVFENN